MSGEDVIPITIEFRFAGFVQVNFRLLMDPSGGLEILFANQKKYSLSIPAKDDTGAQANVAFLVRHLCNTIMKDPRKEMFVLDNTV